MSELLKVSEVARALKVNVNYVHKLITRGQLKAIKLGCLKVPDVELDRFIKDSMGKDLSDLDNIENLCM
ncbi:helix-turn-helix domain-containing protein [Clostridium sulfidigenes]|uniref:helix-turn-helix domain-containing protein n=1 Tax=Clostridium sulfidigenes TaxID=318464 RepID=UPI003F8963E8